MKLKISTDKLFNFKNSAFQELSYFGILIIIVTRLIYTRDFVSGRFEYKWNFATITSQDIKLATIMFMVGVASWYGTAELKRKYKKWRNSSNMEQ